MPNLKVQQQLIPLSQIREIKPETAKTLNMQQLAANGLDEVRFEAAGKQYLGVGESLELSQLKGSSQVQVELGGETVSAKLIDTQDDVSSWSEGWAKGKSLSQSLSLAWQGFSAQPDWSRLDSLSQPVTRWTEAVKPQVGPAQTAQMTQSEQLVVISQPHIQALPADISIPAPIEPAQPIKSAKPGIEVFFTSPGQTPERDPAVALAEFIGSAKQTVSVAAFELDNPTIRDALLKAHANGRSVRVVTDSDYVDEHDIVALKQAGIEVVEDKRSGLMHNKFVVIDQGTADAAVWTGSMNMTDNCVYRNNNNAVLIRSPELAENYFTEFQEMFVDRSFGRTSPSVVPHPRVTVGKSVIDTHFAAEGRVAGKVAEALNKATSSIHFMAFSFTHDGIGEVVAQKFKNNVAVRGVFEKTGSGTQYSEYGRLKALGADVRTDGNSKILHHKVFVIDGKTVVTGSFNFSESADEKNDENLLIIEDPEIAKQYLAEFERVYQTSVNKADAEP